MLLPLFLGPWNLRRLSHNPLSRHLTSSELPLETGLIVPVHCPVPLHLIVLELAPVYVLLGPPKKPESIPLIILELSRVDLTCPLNFVAHTLFFPFRKPTNEDIALSRDLDSESMAETIVKVSGIGGIFFGEVVRAEYLPFSLQAGLSHLNQDFVLLIGCLCFFGRLEHFGYYLNRCIGWLVLVVDFVS